jgi:N-acetylmuramidase/Putative peptidoglycan binding domain
MGMNFRLAGFASAEDMVSAMCDSEDSQLLGFAAFLKSSKLDSALQIHDWTSLARGYNGPNFAANQYDAKLRGEFQKLSTGSLPDITTRAAQLYLNFGGFHPGPVDGVAGSLTQDALRQFQQANGLPVTSLVDDATLAALTPA